MRDCYCNRQNIVARIGQTDGVTPPKRTMETTNWKKQNTDTERPKNKGI